MTFSCQAFTNLATDRMGRVIALASGLLPSTGKHLPVYDPVFLPDYMTLMPDQAQEFCYARRRDQ